MKPLLGFRKAVKLLDCGWQPEQLVKKHNISEENLQKAINANKITAKQNWDYWHYVQCARTRRQRIENYRKNGEMI